MDNDCDGTIDEELCTGANVDTDTDNDGRFDEDCAINRDIGDGKLYCAFYHLLQLKSFVDYIALVLYVLVLLLSFLYLSQVLCFTVMYFT